MMTVREILKSYHHIAVVGISDNPSRPSRSVARYMIHAGYTIYPVNPGVRKILGLTCYPSLTEAAKAHPGTIEIVNIFRRSAEVPPVVEEAIDIGAKVIWMQLGITNDKAARMAEKAGLSVIEDHCIAVEHKRLMG